MGAWGVIGIIDFFVLNGGRADVRALSESHARPSRIVSACLRSSLGDGGELVA